MPDRRKSKSLRARQSKSRRQHSKRKHSQRVKSQRKKSQRKKSHTQQSKRNTNTETWRKNVKKSSQEFNRDATKVMAPYHRVAEAYKDEPKSLKSKVNRILKNDSGRIRLMRKFT